MKLGMGLVIKNKIIPLIPETPERHQVPIKKISMKKTWVGQVLDYFVPVKVFYTGYSPPYGPRRGATFVIGPPFSLLI
jgi:hypothetical protein